MSRPTRSPYRAPGWQKVRAYVLNRDTYRCRIAGPGCTEHATEADHIIPWKFPPEHGGPWFDPTNLRAACKHCNSTRAHRKTSTGPTQTQSVTVPPSRDW